MVRDRSEARKRRGAKELLSAKFVAQHRTPGRYADGDRLFLQVRASGRREWLFRYLAPSGRKRDMSLGDADVVSLKKAREAADDARGLLSRDVDPLDVRASRQEESRLADKAKREADRIERATLARVAREYHERIEGRFRNAKHRAQWIASLEQHVPQAIWHRPIQKVEAHELLDALHELQRRLPETARRVRQRLEAVFDDAILRKLASANPAAAVRRHLRDTVPKGHFAALPYSEVPELVNRLRELPGTAARALEFTILTAARTGEVLGATWGEFDLGAGRWTIPATRMKSGEEHTVYLSVRAIEILEAMRAFDQPYVFPSPVKDVAPMSNMAMLILLRREGLHAKTTVHGLARVTFSTWANENGYRPDVIEACLAHREADRTRAAYNRAEFAEERRALMAAWAKFIAFTPAENIALIADARAARRSR